MDKGKGIADSSQGTGAPAKEQQGGIKSDSDDERRAVTGGVPRVGDEGASSSTTGGGGDGASSSGEPSATQARIAGFEDGQYVRLRNRGRGGYLFADEDGLGVSVDRRRGMVNTAWAVQVLREYDDSTRVLLRSAYGRYLSHSFRKGFRWLGLVGCYARQCTFEYPDDTDIEWTITLRKNGSVVLLQGRLDGVRALRANGRYQRWNTEVTFAPVDMNKVSSMMEWEVQIIPRTLERPPYQPNAAIRLPKGSEEVIEIAYAVGSFGNNGSIEHDQWIAMRFRGRSLIRLRIAIANRLGVQPEKMILFAQAGYLAQPIPLLTDLDVRDDPRLILAFMIDSAGYDALRFPDLAAE